jgi:hypothetical protein
MAERHGRLAAEDLVRRAGYDRTADDDSDRALVRTGYMLTKTTCTQAGREHGCRVAVALTMLLVL